jgi:hypothetical protein
MRRIKEIKHGIDVIEEFINLVAIGSPSERKVSWRYI